MSDEQLEVLPPEEDEGRNVKEEREKQKDRAKYLLAAAFEISSNHREQASDPDPLMVVVGLINPKPVSEWQEPEFKSAIKLFTNVENPEQPNEKALADEVRSYLINKASDKGLEMAEIVGEQPQEHTLGDFLEVAERSLMVMRPESLLQKKQELYLELSRLDPRHKAHVKNAEEIVDSVMLRKDVARMNQLELHLFDPSDQEKFPSTGDTAVDQEFVQFVKLVQEYSYKDDYGTLNDLYEDDFVKTLRRKGMPQHRYFLDVMRGRIDQMERVARGKEYQEQADARMQVVGEKMQTFKEEDRPLYEGTIDQTIKERFRRIMDADEFDPEYDREEIARYFNNVRKWVGVVMNNRDNNPNKRGGGITLDPRREEHFRKIMHDIDPRIMSLDALKEEIKYLQDESENGGRLTRYFMKKDTKENPMDGNGRINYIKARKLIVTNANELDVTPKYDATSMALPETLEQVIDMIQAQYGRHYPINTGEEYELMDVEGNFHVENFTWWIRKHYNYLAGENPMGDINPLSEINIRTTYSNIGLADILYSDQFRQQTLFEITGNDSDEDSITGTWGKKVEHEALPRSRAEVILYELGYNSAAHNSAAKWRFASGSKEPWLKQMEEYHLNSWISRNTWGVLAQMPARGEGDFKGKEYEGSVDGTAGRAWRGQLALYRNLLEWTDYHQYQPGDPRGEAKQKKKFEHNPFYVQLESNGANAFLLSVAEKSIQEIPEAKEQYQAFIQDLFLDAYNMYAAKDSLTADQKERLKQLRKNYMTTKLQDVGDIRLDQSEALLSFHKDVEELIMKRKVTYDKVELMKKGIQKTMLKNLYSDDPESNMFFNRILRIQRFEVAGDTKRLIGYKGGEDGSLTMGNAEYNKQSLHDIVKNFAGMLTPDNYDRFIDYENPNISGVDTNGPDWNSESFNKFIDANETMALAFAKIFAKKDRADLNPFAKGEHLPNAETIIDTAIKRANGEKVFRLDKDEAQYVWNASKDALWPLGIAGFLDKAGISFDFWTRITRLDKHLERQMHRGYPVIEHLIHEIKFMGMPMLEMIKIRQPDEDRPESTLYSLFEGREQGTNRIKRRKDRIIDTDNSIYRSDPGEQMTVIQNHVNNASRLFEILKEGDIDWHGVVDHTGYDGRPIIDKAKLAKVVSDTWKAVRYATDQAGIDYNMIINRDGYEAPIMKLMLGDNTRTLIQVYREKKEKDGGLPPGSLLQESYLKNVGMGIMASMLGEIIREHRDPVAHEHPWDIGTIKRIELAVAKHITDDKTYMPMISREVFDAALTLYSNHSWWDRHFHLGTSYTSMYWAEFWAAVREIAIYTPSQAIEKFVENVPK